MIALREIFAHGIAMHRVEKSPCAEVKASAILGEPPDHRERLKLSDAELRAMLEALPSIGKHNELAIKILLATATRVGELTRARWEHIDFQRRTWTIPAAHAKNRKEFVIPLAEPVAGWFHELREIAFGSDYVLPIRIRRSGKHDDRPMEPTTLNAAVNRLCKSLGDRCRRFVPHDLRSTARSHFAAMGVPVVIAERCLNHALGGLVEVYDQHDYLDERREVLSLWARYIVACETGHAWNVTDIRTARRKRT
jgi:integrase